MNAPTSAARVCAVAQGSAEGRYTAWLMERPDPADGLPQYWNGFHADSFTKDPWQAIQYARKTDALTAGHRMLYAPFGWTLVEHMFIGTESGSDEGRAALDHAARLLALSVTDEMLDSLRADYGNTNVAVVKHWRSEVLAALPSSPAAEPEK